MSYRLCVFLLLAASACHGQISVGDNTSFDILFDKADIVCLCLVTRPAEPQLGIAQQVASVVPDRIYKGNTREDLTEIRTTNDFGLAPRIHYLIFLQRNGGLLLQVTAAIEIPELFLPLKALTKPTSFELDWTEALNRQGSDELKLLALGQYFSKLSPESADAIKRLSSSTRPEVSLSTMSILMVHRIDPEKYFQEFLRELGETQSVNWPDFNDLTSYFLAYATPGDIALLEIVSSSPRLDMRYDALRALRKLGNPSTTDSFLISLTRRMRWLSTWL